MHASALLVVLVLDGYLCSAEIGWHDSSDYVSTRTKRWWSTGF